jgi:PAS domain S-box-containing protein
MISNKLLKRQVEKFGIAENKHCNDFIAAVDQTYTEFENDRKLTERSLEISSDELVEANTQLRLKAEKQEILLGKLKLAILKLQPNEISQLKSNQTTEHFLLDTLDQVIAQRTRFEKTLEKHSQETERKNQDLNNTKTALVNALDDLEKEKEVAVKDHLMDEALLASLGEGAIVTDRNKKLTMLNKAAEDLFGFNKSMYGATWTDIFELLDHNGNKVPVEMTPIQICMDKKQKVSSSEYHFIRKSDQVVVHLAITASPVIIKDKLTGVIVVYRDITKEKNIDQMKTDFISIASHQLRTPMTSIKWFIEMVLDGDAGEINADQRKFLGSALESGKRMVRLINELLDISRIESGRLIINAKRTNLKQVIDSAIKDLSKKIENKHHQISIEIAKEIPDLHLDPQLIQQMYQNLLDNAITYTPEKGIIKVEVKVVADKVISKVIDNGTGVPPNERGNLFEKFFRGTKARTTGLEGTGLGLYLVKAIATISGGEAWYEANKISGSTFAFSLPLTGMIEQDGEAYLSSKK